MANVNSSITRMLSAAKGFARPNRYEAIFQLPAGISNSSEDVNPEAKSSKIQSNEIKFNGSQEISILCSSFNLPGRALLTYEHKQIANPINVPYSMVYEPFTVTFLSDPDLNTRRYFEIWQAAVINLQTNSMNFFAEYAGDITFYQLDREGKRRYGKKIFNAFPLNIGDISYSYDDNNKVQEIPVTFSFSTWQNLEDVDSYKLKFVDWVKQ